MSTRLGAAFGTVALAATVASALLTYRSESGATTDRFVAAARADLASDVIGADSTLQAVDINDNNAVLAAFERYVSYRGVRYAFTSTGLVSGANRTAPDDLLGRTDLTGDGLTGGDPSTRWITGSGGQRWLAAGGSLGYGYGLVEYYDASPLDQQLHTLRIRLIEIAVAAMVVAVIAAMLFARGISGPVRRAAVAAAALGAGDRDVRLPTVGGRELSALAAAFNVMADRVASSVTALQAAAERERQFVADVAHELRTPLAGMVAASAGIDDHPDRAVQLLVRSTARLDALVGDLLEISRLDAGQVEPRYDHFDLAALARDATTAVTPDAQTSLEVRGDTLVVADARRLDTVVRNLVTNAHRHGRPPVTLTIDGTAADRVELTVADAGDGVPADIADTVFERFVHGDTSDADLHRGASIGTGLGLAIARENALLQGARLRHVGGSEFELIVPRSPVAARRGTED